MVQFRYYFGPSRTTKKRFSLPNVRPTGPLSMTVQVINIKNGSIFRATIEQHEPDMYITFIWFIWGGHNPLYGAADPMGVNNLQIKCLFSLLY